MTITVSGDFTIFSAAMISEKLDIWAKTLVKVMKSTVPCSLRIFCEIVESEVVEG
jgi:hypothetical protein